MTERRLRVWEASLDWITDFFKQEEIHLKIVEGKLPNDAKVVGCYFDWEFGRICYVIESSEFDIVGEGMLVPNTPLPIHEIVAEGVHIE